MMTDWDEFIETFAYWTHWKPAKPQAIDEADKARAALRAAITELEQERDMLAKRELELLELISKGKRIKADAIWDFDRYQTAVNAGYVDGLLYAHHARLSKRGQG